MVVKTPQQAKGMTIDNYSSVSDYNTDAIPDTHLDTIVSEGQDGSCFQLVLHAGTPVEW